MIQRLITNTIHPCSAMLPGHQHCEHGHTEDCPDPGECELLPVGQLPRSIGPVKSHEFELPERVDGGHRDRVCQECGLDRRNPVHMGGGGCT